MLDNIWAVHRRTAFQLSEVSNSQEVDRADVQAALDANNRHVSSTFVRINDMRFQVPSPLVSDRSFVISAPEATFITYFHNWLGSLDDDLDEGLKLLCGFHFAANPCSYCASERQWEGADGRVHQFEQLMLTVVRRVVTWDDYSLLRVHRRVDVHEYFRDIREMTAGRCPGGS